MEIIKSCNVNNGGCSHVCREEAAGPTCSCHKGYHLQADGRSCEGCWFLKFKSRYDAIGQNFN